MRQTTDKGKPALCVIIAAAGAFFKKGKGAAMKKNTENTTENSIRNIMLGAFDHAVSETLNEDTKAEALQLTRLYFGEESTEDGHGFKLMTGFLMGVSEGMRIAAAIDATATK